MTNWGRVGGSPFRRDRGTLDTLQTHRSNISVGRTSNASLGLLTASTRATIHRVPSLATQLTNYTPGGPPVLCLLLICRCSLVRAPPVDPSSWRTRARPVDQEMAGQQRVQVVLVLSPPVVLLQPVMSRYIVTTVFKVSEDRIVNFMMVFSRPQPFRIHTQPFRFHSQ